jgi:hypothetical protein
MSRKTGKIRTALLSVMAATAAALLAIPAASASTLPVHATINRHVLANAALNSPLRSLPDEIAQLGTTTLRNVYTGLVVTNNGTHIDVYMTSLTRAAEGAVTRLSRGGTVSFRTAPHTALQLQAVQKMVTQDARSLAARGISLVSWFPGINGDGLENIGVLNLTKAHAKILRRLFGAGNIVLKDVPPNDLPVTTGRNSDSSPWNGGDNLTDRDRGCTSGAGIDYNGTEYMLTAAHCYEPGWTIYNALAGQSGTTMGTEHSRDVSYGGDDTALLSMTPSDLVWTGIIGDPVRTTVTGYATNPDGDTVCNEGAYSGEVCSVVQDNDFGCILASGYAGLSGPRYECNIVWAESTVAGDIANQAGDSGAPMIRYINGDLKVTGIVSASDGSDTTACVYNDTTCYTDVYYTAMDEILSTEYPGSTIVSG